MGMHGLLRGTVEGTNKTTELPRFSWHQRLPKATTPPCRQVGGALQWHPARWAAVGSGEGVQSAIGCHGTSPREGWAAIGQSGGRGRSHPPQSTARWSVLVALRAENEDSWTMQVAAVVTMHEVDGTDTAEAERGPVLDLSWACPGLAVNSAPHSSKSSVRSSCVQREIQCLTSDVGSICSAPCC